MVVTGSWISETTFSSRCSARAGIWGQSLILGPEMDLRRGIRDAVAVKYPVGIDLTVKMVTPDGCRFPAYSVAGGQITLVRRSGGDRSGVHQSYGRDLPVLNLGTLPVGEVSGGVADGEGIVGRCVSRAEAGARRRRSSQ